MRSVNTDILYNKQLPSCIKQHGIKTLDRKWNTLAGSEPFHNSVFDSRLIATDNIQRGLKGNSRPEVWHYKSTPQSEFLTQVPLASPSHLRRTLVATFHNPMQNEPAMPTLIQFPRNKQNVPSRHSAHRHNSKRRFVHGVELAKTNKEYPNLRTAQRKHQQKNRHVIVASSTNQFLLLSFVLWKCQKIYSVS